MISDLVGKALSALSESRQIDFKTELDFDQPHTWCEFLKDIVAMANTLGGVILVGVDDFGRPTGNDVRSIFALDPAVVSDKIRKYTGVDFDEFEISAVKKGRRHLVAIEIQPTDIPMVFIKPGTYPVENGKQKTAFAKGSVYFRHGAKSEPGTTGDLRSCFERRLKSVRNTWMSGVRKVVKAPLGSTIVALEPNQEVIQSSSSHAIPVRLTNDPTAPAYRGIGYDQTHPYRQKELIKVVNTKLGERAKINSYDVQCIKNVFDIWDDERYCHRPKFSSPQYSEAFADWIIEQFESDPSFFISLREGMGSRTKKHLKSGDTLPNSIR